MEKYGLDLHGEMLLEEYRQQYHLFEQLNKVVMDSLNSMVKKSDIELNSMESRIKKEDSLVGKLKRKGSKYKTLMDITDIFGARIIAFYNEDVDRIASMAEQLFEIDWPNSVDKRKMHEFDSFGYNSLHYICSIPKSLYFDPEHPELNQIRFELQMRTALQHVWSAIEHDIGYKGTVRLPPEYRRQFSRLAGMLELADDEFSRLRTTMNKFRRHIHALVESGRLDEVPLNSDTFRSFLEMKPFDKLNQRIAAVNQADIYPASLLPFRHVLESFQLETLGDVDALIRDYSDDAYQLALAQFAITDLDIVSEYIGLQNLCFVYVLKNGGGRTGIKAIYDILYGPQEGNADLADLIVQQASQLPFYQQNT